jgi:hypothetical protein
VVLISLSLLKNGFEKEECTYGNKKILLQYVCRECQREQMRERYANNKENVLAINRQSTQKSQMRASAFIQEYLFDKYCLDCGENDINVLTFDHVTGKKKYNIANMISKATTLKP